MKVYNKCQILNPSGRHSPNHSSSNMHICSSSLWFTGCFMRCPPCRLVIASRFHPCPVLIGLLKFLAPSRPFVVYSQYKEVSSSPVAEPRQLRWSSPTEWTLFILERALISCHWTQVLLFRAPEGNAVIMWLQPTSLSLPKSYNARHAPALISSFVLMVLKPLLCVSVCVCWLVDSAVLLVVLVSHLFPLRSLQPLIECYTKLKEQGCAVSLRLTDTWLRHYQVRFNSAHASAGPFCSGRELKI